MGIIYKKFSIFSICCRPSPFYYCNFPGCLGALDGMHVCIECPGGGGSAYYNYKEFHSIVLMALCDARYCFTLVDIGAYGRDNDAIIFNNSIFGKHFHSGNIILPNDIKEIIQYLTQ